MKMLSVFVWLSFTATSVIGILAGALGVLSFGGGQGPGGMFDGVGIIMGIELIGICSVALLCCLVRMPPKELRTTGNLRIASGLYGLTLVLLWTIPHVANAYTLTVQVLDSDKKPIQEVQIEYDDYNREEGLSALTSWPAKGTVSTDVAGRVTLRTNRHHLLQGFLAAKGYRYASFEMQEEYSKKHEVSISWAAQGANPDTNRPHFSRHVPAAREVSITVYLPRENEGNVLPYAENP
jgi:hypothetical protein